MPILDLSAEYGVTYAEVSATPPTKASGSGTTGPGILASIGSSILGLFKNPVSAGYIGTPATAAYTPPVIPAATPQIPLLIPLIIGGLLFILFFLKPKHR